MFDECQTTIAKEVSVSGIGLHTGDRVTVVLKPAPAEFGIVVEHRGSRSPIHPQMTERNQLCTRLRTRSGSVDTVEHLMAALAIVGVDNVIICVAGDEVPILDGSAAGWSEAINSVGLLRHEQLRRRLKICRPFRFEVGSSVYQASPFGAGISVTIDFPGTVIGKQSSAVSWFATKDLLDARTFVLEKEIPFIRQMGLAKGGSLENAIVVGDQGPLNIGGLRSPDEFARHKALDLVGDLYLLGKRISGQIHALRPGHAGNNAFLLAMIASGVLVEQVAAAVRPISKPFKNSKTAMEAVPAVHHLPSEWSGHVGIAV